MTICGRWPEWPAVIRSWQLPGKLFKYSCCLSLVCQDPYFRVEQVQVFFAFFGGIGASVRKAAREGVTIYAPILTV